MTLSRFSVCYHGTISPFAVSIAGEIDLSAGRSFTDFGQGFYMTNNRNQAVEWAKRKYKDHAAQHPDADAAPALVKLILDTERLAGLEGLVFLEPDDRWAEFVYNCRKAGKEGILDHGYSFVCGALADGKIGQLLNRAMLGKITQQQFYHGIRPLHRQQNQLSLHTVEAIRCIQSREVETVEFKLCAPR